MARDLKCEQVPVMQILAAFRAILSHSHHALHFFLVSGQFGSDLRLIGLVTDLFQRHLLGFFGLLFDERQFASLLLNATKFCRSPHTTLPKA